MQCEILYFARLRETFGKAHEAVALPAAVTSVDSLLDWLRLRGEPWSSELAAGKMFRIAVNQEMANGSTALADGCEIAIFPPVTGG
ncbi:MAG: molybdopterin converting factor subunit 1 [Chitinivorax sp.]